MNKHKKDVVDHNPWLAMAGMHDPDDPLVQDWKREMAAYRQAVEDDMVFLNWLGLGGVKETTPKPCDFCADPVSANLEDLGIEGPKDCYLCRCPTCGQYWGGHGHTPQYRWALTPEEAAELFPSLSHAAKKP